MKPKTPLCKSCELRGGGVFCTLKGALLTRLDKEKSVHNYQKGQVIFYEGNPPLGIYCIYSGRVKLYKVGRKGRQQIIRVVGPGEIMGYRALLANETFSATAEALEATTICVIPKLTLVQLLQQSHELALQFMAKLGHELSLEREQLMSLTQESVKQRTARLLLLLLEGGDKKPETTQGIKVPFLRREMAEMIGVAPETLARTLQHFVQKGVILVKGSQIYVNNLSRLKTIAYGHNTEI